MSFNEQEQKKAQNKSSINPRGSRTQISLGQGFKEEKKLIYKSEVMARLMSMVHKVARSHSSTLILGESGTGKELVARAIHDNSSCKKGPFVVVNCGVLRESLLESELFGYEKGAFTGADNRKIGLAETANGGTLFLDEIGDISLAIQAKLLRFLQEGEIFRVGGKEPIKLNVRLITATNKELEKDVEEERFREDLFYRINTIILKMAPLRRRKEDIRPLFDFFMKAKKNSKALSPSLKVSESVYEVLERYSWPGNVRELQNLCERLNVLYEGKTVHVESLPTNMLSTTSALSSGSFSVEYMPGVSLSELEKQYIIQALTYFKGNKTQVANALGITIKTLYNKLHEYGEFERFSIQGRSQK